MSILQREHLDDGSFGQRLGMPAELTWTQAQLDASLAELLAARPPGAVWVFGYGSLMWNPLLQVEQQVRATLHGWQRRFCMRTTAGRGTPERPGRMLSLEPGGQAQGLALRLPAATLHDELRVLWRREMVTGAYLPRWLPVVLADGSTVQAIVFVANPTHPQHEADASVAAVVPVIAGAAGAFGANTDYVHALARALAAHGLQDDYVAAICVHLP